MTSRFRLAIPTAVLAVSMTASAASTTREMRVAFVGDSLAYGAGDEAGKGIAGRLEPELRSRGFESVVTTNLAVTGATTGDLAAALRRDKTRAAIATADVVVLSIGANDLRHALVRGDSTRSPLLLADDVLQGIDSIVAEIRSVNPNSRILILGAYIPVKHERALLLFEPLVAVWDATLMAQFAHDPLIAVVRLSDIIDRPERLSRLDSFHPGGDAYQETAKRIAELLTR